MTDYFSLLNVPRRPWLDPEALRHTFLALATRYHPDRVHNADEAEKAAANAHYAELNAAYQSLAEPKTRLLHLLELETGKPKDIQAIPIALADLFAAIAGQCREADAFLAEREKVTSPLLKIQWFERAQEWIERLNAQQQQLNELRTEVTARLRQVDGEWARITEARGDQQPLLAKLEELYRYFGYFNRWQNQLHERIARLSF